MEYNCNCCYYRTKDVEDYKEHGILGGFDCLRETFETIKALLINEM